MDDIKRVVTALSSVVSTEKIMLVGARCRDIHQKNIVGGEASRATKDIDFALALENWELFRALKQRFPSTTNAWQSVLVEGITLDIIPFGELEEPLGEVSSGYTHKLNVRGMQEVFEHAQFLQLGDGLTIRMPTVSGLAALKMFAWLDRGRETYKDAQDLALILEWVAKDDNALWERVDEIPENIGANSVIWLVFSWEAILIRFLARNRVTLCWLGGKMWTIKRLRDACGV